jgi:DNA-binding NtrC family response regulator
VYQESESAQANPVTASQGAGNYWFVIDDDAGICKAMCFTLRKMGLGTTELATPAALETALGEHRPSLVFLDLGLGESGALDVLPILARHNYAGPVQLMSGRAQSVLDEVVKVGEEHGLKMLPALTKPFRMGVIKDLVGGLGLAPPASASIS